MKKSLLYISIALSAVSFFWACADGNLEWAGDEDYLAIERFDKATEADILAALGQCEGDPECVELITEEFRNNPLTKKDTSVGDTDIVDTTASSSSKADSSEVSSSSEIACDTCLVESSSDTEVSSSSEDVDTLSSSSADTTVVDSTLSSSSVDSKESSSSVASSSSALPESSSEKENPASSSEPVVEESSSSAEPESSSQKLLPVNGTCERVGAKNVVAGNKMKWRYKPNEGTVPGSDFVWICDDATEETAFQQGNLSEVEMQFNDPVSTTYPKLEVDGVEIDCSSQTLTVVAGQQPSSAVESSSSEASSSSIYIEPPESSSSVACKMVQIEVNGQIYWDCRPIEDVSSSSATQPASSADVPASSAEESSSSAQQEPESSSNAVVDIAITNSVTTIEPGSYRITSCSGGGQLICATTDGTKKTFLLNGTQCTAFEQMEYGACGGSTCRAGTLETEYKITCKGGW